MFRITPPFPWTFAFAAFASVACGPIAGTDQSTLQAAETGAQEAAAIARERRVLERETPRGVTADELAAAAGFGEFPSRIFAPKNGGGLQADKLLGGVGKQIYQQALMSSLTGDMQYADNARDLIQKLVDVDFNFKSDPARPNDTNDNRYLAAAWFMSHVARGARILEQTAPDSWKRKGWQQTLDAFNAWVDQGRDTSGTKPMIQLIADRGTMRWVSDSDQQGSTNRTFALLEAQMRLAELRGGKLAGDRSIEAIFAEFRGYLSRYWSAERNCLGDGAYPGSQSLRCLPNKDEDRHDTYHPLMGLASIVHIVDIGRRFQLELSAGEREKVIRGLRWGADNNTSRPGPHANRQLTYDVPVWEMARRHFSPSQLGPLAERDWLKARSADWSVRAGKAWGYTLLAVGY